MVIPTICPGRSRAPREWLIDVLKTQVGTDNADRSASVLRDDATQLRHRNGRRIVPDGRAKPEGCHDRSDVTSEPAVTSRYSTAAWLPSTISTHTCDPPNPRGDTDAAQLQQQTPARSRTVRRSGTNATGAFSRYGVSRDAVKQAQSGLQGTIVLPGDPQYNADRVLFNPVFDPYPAMIIYCRPRAMPLSHSACQPGAAAGGGAIYRPLRRPLHSRLLGQLRCIDRYERDGTATPSTPAA